MTIVFRAKISSRDVHPVLAKSALPRLFHERFAIRAQIWIGEDTLHPAGAWSNEMHAGTVASRRPQRGSMKSARKIAHLGPAARPSVPCSPHGSNGIETGPCQASRGRYDGALSVCHQGRTGQQRPLKMIFRVWPLACFSDVSKRGAKTLKIGSCLGTAGSILNPMPVAGIGTCIGSLEMGAKTLPPGSGERGGGSQACHGRPFYDASVKRKSYPKISPTWKWLASVPMDAG